MATGQPHAGRQLVARHREAAVRYSQPRGQRRDPGVGRYFQETGRHSPDGCTAYGVTFHDAAYHAVALAFGGVFVTADERYVRLPLQTLPNRIPETSKSPARPPNHHRLPVQLVEMQEYSPVPGRVQDPRGPAEGE